MSQPEQEVQQGLPTGSVHGHGLLAASVGIVGSVITQSSHVIDHVDSEGRDLGRSRPSRSCYSSEMTELAESVGTDTSEIVIVKIPAYG